jgi:hypothetical protein
MLAAAPLVFVFDRTPSRFPMPIWIPWVLIVAFSVLWADPLDLASVQSMCQIITPIIIAPIASKAMKSVEDLKTLLKSFSHCLLILLTAQILYMVAGVGNLGRPMAMTAAIVGCVFVAQIRERPLVAVLGWCGCLLVAGLSGSRMATLAILLEWLILPGYRHQMARLFATGAIAALAVGLFYTPLFQERFFLEGEGTLADVADGEISGSGRFEAWPKLWKEVARRPILGAGAHGSARIVNKVWQTSYHPHNDYLRILLEQGVVGLSFFLLGVIGQLLSLWSRRPSGCQEIAAIRSAAHVGILVMLLMAVTDNPIVYGVWFMHPLFVLIGASYSRAPLSDRDAREHSQ